MKTFDINSFTEKGSIKKTLSRREFLGIGYKDGRMVASNCYMLASIKGDYPAEREGRTYAGDIMVADKTIPAEKVLTKARENQIRVKIDFRAIKRVLRCCKGGTGLGRPIGEFDIPYISIPVDGDFSLLFSHLHLSKIIAACEFFGIDEMRVSSRPYCAVYFGNDKAEFALMPAKENPLPYIDIEGKVHNITKWILEDVIKQWEWVVTQGAGKTTDEERLRQGQKKLTYLKKLRTRCA